MVGVGLLLNRASVKLAPSKRVVNPVTSSFLPVSVVVSLMVSVTVVLTVVLTGVDSGASRGVDCGADCGGNSS